MSIAFNQPEQRVCVQNDTPHFMASHSTPIGEMMSPIYLTDPRIDPKMGFRSSRACVSSATGLPRLVMTTRSPLSATSSIIFKHLALNSEAVMVRTPDSL